MIRLLDRSQWTFFECKILYFYFILDSWPVIVLLFDSGVASRAHPQHGILRLRIIVSHFRTGSHSDYQEISVFGGDINRLF